MASYSDLMELAQEKDHEKWPLAYASCKLLNHKCKYSTIEMECLVIKWAVELFSYYLLGRSFMLVTDHAPLR